MDISALTPEQQIYATEIIKKCIISREYFIKEILGVEKIEDWQLEAIHALDRGETKLSVRSGHGVGKHICYSAVVPTPSGYRRWGELQPGDYLFGKDGEPTEILQRHEQGVKKIYRVLFDDGSSAMAGGEHLWSVRGRNSRRTGANTYEVLSTDQIVAAGVQRRNGATTAKQWEIPRQGAAQYPTASLPIDPYVLGVWLGDGTQSSGSITSGDKFVWNRLASMYNMGADSYVKISAEVRTLYGLVTELRALGVLNDKHIPEAYMTASVEQRTALLRGLLDSDGYVSGPASTCVGFDQCREHIVDSVVELARSLGMKASRTKTRTGWYYHGDTGERVECKQSYRCSITSDLSINPFSLPRKADAIKAPDQERYLTRWIDSVEYSHDEEAMCVTVAAEDSLYLTQSYIVTHNTFLCSILALHFLLFREDTKVIVTSPGFKQMTDGLIPEVAKWIDRLPEWMSSSIESTKDRIVRHPNYKGNFISFRTARKENPEALAGVHAENVLVIVDEASGVDEIIYETGMGILSTPGAIIILIGNPTKPSGFFYKTHTLLKKLWWTRKVSCLDSTRVDESYIESQKLTYGIDSRQYAVRVLGEFPASGADSVIPRDTVEGAIDRDVYAIEGDTIWGIDPGRGGDPTGFVERRANVLITAEELKYVDLMRVVGWVVERYADTTPRLRPSHICIDSIGLGAGVADRLTEVFTDKGWPCNIVHVNVSEASSMSDRYMRLRAEVWYNVRAWFEKKDVKILPFDARDQIVEELVAVEQIIMSTGKVDIESKDTMKKRGVPSPNLADALCLTFAVSGAIQIGAYNTGSWSKVNTLDYRAPGL